MISYDFCIILIINKMIISKALQPRKGLQLIYKAYEMNQHEKLILKLAYYNNCN
jgi:hypothetical protein